MELEPMMCPLPEIEERDDEVLIFLDECTPLYRDMSFLEYLQQ